MLLKRARLCCQYHESSSVAVTLSAPRAGRGKARLSSSWPVARERFRISEEVQDAVRRGAPVVALESTIFTHGVPQNSATDVALQCERAIRQEGALPATIGILNGIATVGLSESEIEQLANAQNRVKVAGRDVGAALLQRSNGGTTVSATAALAHRAGIAIFATGGLGGVHRQAQTTFDISSDLTTLGRTPMLVVCSGVKSLLDIGLTLEYLETAAVTVAAYAEGSTNAPDDDFPAFYCGRSGFRLKQKQTGLALGTPAAVAELLRAIPFWVLHTLTELLEDFNKETGQPGGLLLGVPIPDEYSPLATAIQQAVDQAVQESEANGVSKSGKAVTPWLLNRVRELTGGRSLQASPSSVRPQGEPLTFTDIALVKNNASIAARIACAYSALYSSDTAGAMPIYHFPRHETGLKNDDSFASFSQPVIDSPKAGYPLVVIGSASLDINARPRTSFKDTTALGSVSYDVGGVAKNIAEAAMRLGVEHTLLCSPVGDDLGGKVVREGLQEIGLSTAGLINSESGAKTAVVNQLVAENGDLIGGVADFEAAEKLTELEIKSMLGKADAARVIAFDGNIGHAAMRLVLQWAAERHKTTLFEPTSSAKAGRVIEALKSRDGPLRLGHATPNEMELKALYEAAQSHFEQPAWFEALDGYRVGAEVRSTMERRLPRFLLESGMPQMALHLLPLIENLWITLGSRGLYFCGLRPASSITTADEEQGVVVRTAQPGVSLLMRHFKPLADVKQVNVIGAGDSLAAAICVHLVRGTTDVGVIANAAQRAAVETLGSEQAVSRDLSPELL